MPETAFDMLESKPPHCPLEHGNPPFRKVPLTDEQIRAIRHAYYANVSLIDDKIGEIIEELNRCGEYDNTLILFSTDHGAYLGDFALIDKGQYIHEALMRIPFLAKPPIAGYKARRESALVCSVDIAATCISAAGGTVPDYVASRDLSIYWESSSDVDDRDDVYMEAGGIHCIRDRRWKYAYYAGRDYGELYDLENDPAEKLNLWDSPDLRDLKKAMKSRLLDRVIELSGNAWVPWNDGAPPI